MTKGDKFEREFVLTEHIQNGFIQLFEDRNPLHVDKAYAVNFKFDGVVMHGNILNGFLSYFVGECLPVKNVVIHEQQIKYSNPVYLNDVLILGAEITEVFESVQSLEIKFSFRKKVDSVVVAKGKIQIGELK